MKSLLHRINQLSKSERRRIKLIQSGRAECKLVECSHDPECFELFMRGMIGLALEDPCALRRWRVMWAGPKGSGWRPKTPFCVKELRRIFETIHHKFIKRLISVGEDDAWVSYSLTFMAMRRCARIGKPLELAYVYRACQNAHKSFLEGDDFRCHWVETDEPPEPTVEPGTDSADLAMDIETALGRLDSIASQVVRMKSEGATYDEIGKALCIDPSTAYRRYNSAIARLRNALKNYAPEQLCPAQTAASTEGQHRAA